MAQVTNLTGIQAHTLRVWERRHDFVRAQRKTSNVRYYNEEQLKKLLNTAILLKHGYRISSIVQLREEQIHDHVENVLSNSAAVESEHIRALVLSMLLLNEASFHKIYDQNISTLGIIKTYEQLVFPFLELVGSLWVYNKTNPAYEHFITNLIRQKLIAAIDRLPAPKNNAKCIVLLLLEGDDHELGLLLGSYLAKAAGWKVIYLGVRVPAADVESIVHLTKAICVFSTFTISSPKQQSALIEAIRTKPQTKILLSGRNDILTSFPEDEQIMHLETPRDFRDLLVTLS